MYHWTDRKIHIHAFYCMLGISLSQCVHCQAKAAWSDLSVEQLIAELQQISAVRSALPTARWERPGSRGLRALEADSCAAGFGQGAEA
jgi:hypothetical protein